MEDKIRIDTGRLGMDAESVDQCIQNIQTEMENMKLGVAEMNQMWEGPSKEEFNRTFLTDMEAVSVMIRNLQMVYTYETTAVTEYVTCERDVASMIEEIRI